MKERLRNQRGKIIGGKLKEGWPFREPFSMGGPKIEAAKGSLGTSAPHPPNPPTAGKGQGLKKEF